MAPYEKQRARQGRWVRAETPRGFICKSWDLISLSVSEPTIGGVYLSGAEHCCYVETGLEGVLWAWKLEANLKAPDCLRRCGSLGVSLEHLEGQGEKSMDSGYIWVAELSENVGLDMGVRDTQIYRMTPNF